MWKFAPFRVTFACVCISCRGCSECISPPLRFIFARSEAGSHATGKQVEGGGGVVHRLVGGVGGLGVGGWKAGRRRRRTCRHRPACARPGGTWRAGTKRRVGVYTRGRHSLNLAVETLAPTRSQISDQDGRRQGRKGFRESEAEGGLEERQGWTPVPRWKVRCCNL